MTNTIPNVTRELLERIKSLCEYWFVSGQQQHMSATEYKTWHALGFGSRTFSELYAILASPAPADHVEDVRVMVKAQCVVMPERWLDDKSIEQVFINSGGKWDGDRWVIEDADLHPFVRSFADPAVPAADGWISVSERLPGEDDQVLCWCEDETVAWAEVSSHHNSFFTDMTHELLPVTHWMPLPAAPAARRDQGVPSAKS